MTILQKIWATIGIFAMLIYMAVAGGLAIAGEHTGNSVMEWFGIIMLGVFAGVYLIFAISMVIYFIWWDDAY